MRPAFVTILDRRIAEVTAELQRERAAHPDGSLWTEHLAALLATLKTEAAEITAHQEAHRGEDDESARTEARPRIA